MGAWVAIYIADSAEPRTICFLRTVKALLPENPNSVRDEVPR
jgi:hypothetical protein